MKNYKDHPGSFYTSRSLNETLSLLNLPSTEIQINDKNDDNKNDLSDKNNYKHHSESFCTSHHPSSGLAQQVKLLNLSSTNDDNKNDLSDKNNYKHHSESFCTSHHPSSGLTQQFELLNISSTNGTNFSSSELAQQVESLLSLS